MTLDQWIGTGSAIGGGLLTGAAYNKLEAIGEESLLGTTLDDGRKIPGAIDLANQAVGMSQFKPFTVTSSTGSEFGATPTMDALGNITGTNVYNTLGGTEQAIQNELLRQAQAGFAGGTMGSPEAAAAGLNLMGRGTTQLGQDPYGINTQQLLAQSAADLGGMFMSQLAQPMAGRETDVYNRLRAIQAPEEERQRLALEERLFNQGRMGVQTNMYGGTPEQFALSKAQAEAQNQASLMAMQQAQAEQQQQAALGSQFAGLGSNLALSEGAMRDAQQRRAIQSLSSGQQMLAGGLGLQQGQQQLNLGALSGAYMPQAQMLNVQQASQLYPQMQQQGQLYGAGQYGETMMSGLEARLIAEQARANLIGGVGTGLLSGLTQPVTNTKTGTITTLLGQLGINSDTRLKTNIEKVTTVNGINLYTWDWNEEGQKFSNNNMTFGVLAQEIAEVRPSAVSTDSNGYLMVDYSQIPEALSAVYLGGV
jgi:hypothetical protein